MTNLRLRTKLYEAYYTLHDENRRILYDKKLREENDAIPWNTGSGKTQQTNKPSGRDTGGRYSPESESEEDDEWKERMRTEEEHERTKRMKSENEARERAESQAEQDKNERDRRNWYEYPPPSEDSGDDGDDERARKAREHRERTKRQREAGDRAYTQAKEKEEREWLNDLKARLESLVRLRKKIETMNAKIEDMDLEDAAILKSEQRLKSRRAYRTSIWNQITENEEIEQARKRAGRLQARTSETIKVRWVEKELKQRENDYDLFLSLQGRQRREQADRVEAALRATTEPTTQQEAKEKRVREKEKEERRAREKEEIRKEAEGMRRQVEREHQERGLAREEARKAELRETQKDEAVRRQRVLEKIDKHKQETLRQESRSAYFSEPKPDEGGLRPSHFYTSESVFVGSTERARSREVPPSRNHQPRFRTNSPTPAYNPSTSSYREREQSSTVSFSSSSSSEGLCNHEDFWPKIKGGHECGNCARSCNAFIFRCPDCGILACAFCRDQLRGGGFV